MCSGEYAAVNVVLAVFKGLVRSYDRRDVGKVYIFLNEIARGSDLVFFIRVPTEIDGMSTKSVSMNGTTVNGYDSGSADAIASAACSGDIASIDGDVAVIIGVDASVRTARCTAICYKGTKILTVAGSLVVDIQVAIDLKGIGGATVNGERCIIAENEMDVAIAELQLAVVCDAFSNIIPTGIKCRGIATTGQNGSFMTVYITVAIDVIDDLSPCTHRGEQGEDEQYCGSRRTHHNYSG